MRNIVYTFLLLLISSCAQIGPRLEIMNDKSNNHKEELKIYTNIKRAEFGIIFFRNISLICNAGGEKIEEVSFYNENDSLLWKIDAKNENILTVRPIVYGVNNQGYNQVYPKQDEKVEALKLNNVYRIVISSGNNVIDRKFVYNKSTIYLHYD